MAAKFTFRLETVLRLRRRAFEEAQRVVAERLRAIAGERSIIAAARASWEDHRTQSRTVQGAERLDVAAVRSYRTHMLFLNRRVADCEARIRRHETQLETERAAMVAAQVAVKAIEKLKERRFNRYLDEVNRRENAELGECALQAHRRQDAEAL
jgi:flagellar FliJ protein